MVVSKAEDARQQRLQDGKGVEAELALAVPVWVRLQRYGERTTDAGELLQTPAEDPATVSLLSYFYF